MGRYGELVRKLIATIILVLMVASVANAQGICAPKNIIFENLGLKYGELRGWYGLTNNRGVTLELYLQPEGGSWTILKVFAATGWACIIDAGSQWWPVLSPRIGETP